jgi:hypothetical protein
MRHFGLEYFQLLARIVRAFTTKGDTSSGGTFGHLTFVVAIKAPSFRTAAVALQFFNWFLNTFSNCMKPCRMLSCPDIYRTRRTKQAADSGEPFVGQAISFISIFHNFLPYISLSKNFGQLATQ